MGDVAAYTYDGSGNLISCTDPDGCTMKYTYSVRRRLLRELQRPAC
ncbi:MAG: hypothetical protein HFF83_04375 [Oscillibacter sp.]|nr:hypothetical protein [Oscillibacter sp.]